MSGEILTIGDELCNGEIHDTNSVKLAESLWDVGIPVAWMTSCRDVANDIRQALEIATKRASLVLVSGGLGPTSDDCTVDVVSALLGVPSQEDPIAKERLEAHWKTRGWSVSTHSLRQTRAPASARIFANRNGFAPGFEVLLNEVSVICMPGVPRELNLMLKTEVLPYLASHPLSSGRSLLRRRYRVFGLSESSVSQAIETAIRAVPNVSLHFRTQFPETFVTLIINETTHALALSRQQAAETILRDRLAHHWYGVGDETLAYTTAKQLKRIDATVATAESCTGGLLGGAITSVPGASAYYRGGVITYSNQEKQRQLGIPASLLEKHGAVSEPCATAMAQNVRMRLNTTYGISITGIAGPDGGTEAKPIGLVWIAVADANGCITRRLNGSGGRDRVRTLAVYTALSLLGQRATKEQK